MRDLTEHDQIVVEGVVYDVVDTDWVTRDGYVKTMDTTSRWHTVRHFGDSPDTIFDRVVAR